ncbi:c-type cytochrome [Luteimicrobium subarcticum]|uniref:Cytochrome bc1 complex cytochrome c subunit n=1 Tax=Luteimicrobium subarcticum TaxID=620910 RepID=A0A2M8WRL9_9MICO|nr:cytochrome c [Luteimicrobium subarcticum]PJI93486.1 menaquinol-cytochrome c reductase cytochrome c1 subunit precursor [Luteimicrobium subarcticum]
MKALAARRHHRSAPVVLLLLALLVTGGVYAVLAPSQARADTASTQDIETGKKLFQANCATCHGLDAQGTETAPSLIGVGAASVDFQVSTGRMPAEINGPQAQVKPRQFDDDETAALAAYVASLGAGPAIPTDEQVDPAKGNPATGADIFRTNCAMCHNAVGAGGALSEGKYAPSLFKTSPRNIYQAMLTGPQSMPVFNDANITPDEKRDVIAYLVAQRDGSPGGATLGSLGAVSEGIWAWIVGIGLLVGAAVWIGAKSS